MTKQFRVICNWKMNKTISEAVGFVKKIPPLLAPTYIAVPFTALNAVASLDIPMLQIGAQNIYPQPEGAFTGEVSAPMVREAGAEFVIVGHSERRQIFSETSEFVNKKVKAAILHDLMPILCIGESALDRENGQAAEVLKTQLLESLKEIEPKTFKNLGIAYEPVWAIGTGKPSTAQSAQEVHFMLRNLIQEHWGEDEAQEVFILYGGSVSPDSVEELMKQPDIDGVLVGGASLNLQTYSKIIELVRGDLS